MNEKRYIIEELKLYETMFQHTKEQALIYNTRTLNEAVEKFIIKPEGKKPISRKEFVNGYLQQ
jgi:hypothetical protein